MSTPISKSLAQQAVDVLNEALKADGSTLRTLVSTRYECNGALADHPTIQVAMSGKKPVVGLLGIINGIVERQTGERIAACYDSEDGFNLIGFRLTSDIENAKLIKGGVRKQITK